MNTDFETEWRHDRPEIATGHNNMYYNVKPNLKYLITSSKVFLKCMLISLKYYKIVLLLPSVLLKI